jgi:hypothetical protein
MSEPKPDATCGTCPNLRDIRNHPTGGASGWCPLTKRLRLVDEIHPCHVLPTPCPPPGFLFTKRDGTKAPNVPRNDRKPGSPWAWPVCPRCHGDGKVWPGVCPYCSGTGDLRPTGKQHKVSP